MNEHLGVALFEAKLKKPHNHHIWQARGWWCFAKHTFTLLLCPQTNLLYITENGNTRDFLTMDVNRNCGALDGDAKFKRFWDLTETTIQIMPIDDSGTDYNLIHKHVIWLLYQHSCCSCHMSVGTNYLLSYNKTSETSGFWQWDSVRIHWNSNCQDQITNS